MARALVGSEGTCALVLEATTRLVHSPPERSLVVLGYPDIPSSGNDVPCLMGFEPIGCEFTSRRSGQPARQGLRLRREDRLPPVDAWVLLEFGGDTKAEADARPKRCSASSKSAGRAESPAVREPGGRECGLGGPPPLSGTARMPVGLGGHGGWPNWEDAAVPPDRLGGYLRDYTALLDRHGYDGVFYGHCSQAASTAASTSAAPEGACVPLLHGGRRGPRGVVRRLAVRRTRRRPEPGRAPAQDVRPGAVARSAVSRRCGTPSADEPPQGRGPSTSST